MGPQVNKHIESPEDYDVMSDFFTSLDRQRNKLVTKSYIKNDNSLVNKNVTGDGKPQVFVEYEYVAPQVHQSDIENESDQSHFQPEDRSYFIHTVTQADTIQGIVLRYGVSFSQIRQLNHMTSDRLTSFSTLKIPKTACKDPTHLTSSEAVSNEAKLIHTFKSIFPKFGEPEIRFYLNDSNWNFEQAVKECVRDSKWENEIGRMVKKKSVIIEKKKRDDRKYFLNEEDEYNQIEAEATCGKIPLGYLFSRRRESNNLEERLLSPMDIESKIVSA